MYFAKEIAKASTRKILKPKLNVNGAVAIGKIDIINKWSFLRKK
jgi:hypothetical protein